MPCSGAINNSNYGWLLDVTSNSDVDTVSAGISVIFSSLLIKDFQMLVYFFCSVNILKLRNVLVLTGWKHEVP